MGCGASTENHTSENQENSKQVQRESNVVAQNCNESLKIKKVNNLILTESNNTCTDVKFAISPQESIEVLVPKTNKPRTSVGKKQSLKSNDSKSKELKQVQAWGKKTSTNATSFLEDLRTQQRENNPFYEQDYEISEVDETARFMEGGDQDSGMIMDSESLSEISDSSIQVFKTYKEREQEESFDVSKIIDVEKFRAANVQGEKKDDKNNQMGSNSKTQLPGGTQGVTRFHHDVKKETSNDELYNDDDRNLIESIEKEFLITQDNFLPGQIVN